MIKAIIFDLDNTLLDFIKMKENAISAAIEGMIDAGMDINPKEAYHRIMEMYEETGWENQLIFNDYLNEINGEVNYKFLASAIVSYRRARDGSLSLYPGVKRTLMALSKMGIKLTIISDAPRREAWLRICYLNLHHYFDLVLTFDDIGERKPSSKGFELTLSKLKINVDNVIMVGDWPERDMVGAKKLGIKTIFAKYGDTFNRNYSCDDWDVKNIFEIVDIIKKINEK